MGVTSIAGAHEKQDSNAHQNRQNEIAVVANTPELESAAQAVFGQQREAASDHDAPPFDPLRGRGGWSLTQ